MILSKNHYYCRVFVYAYLSAYKDKYLIHVFICVCVCECMHMCVLRCRIYVLESKFLLKKCLPLLWRLECKTLNFAPSSLDCRWICIWKSKLMRELYEGNETKIPLFFPYLTYEL
jgi:hypothetical protein